MTRKAFILLVAAVTPTETLLAQSPLSTGVFEAQGSAFYSFSNQTGSPYPGETVDRYFRQHNIWLQPSIGYFLKDDWQLIVQPRYLFQLSTYGFSSTESERWSYNLGILVGISFHIPISQSVISFVALSSGLNWRKVTDISDGYVFHSQPWSKPEVTFPNVAVGVKVFIVPNWALIPQAQFTHISYPERRTYEKETILSFGIGFAVYFNHKDGS